MISFLYVSWHQVFFAKTPETKQKEKLFNVFLSFTVLVLYTQKKDYWKYLQYWFVEIEERLSKMRTAIQLFSLLNL